MNIAAPIVNQKNEDFNWRVRVYYEDTDSGGIVFYANYLKFFERARTEWLRAAGISQRLLTETDNVMFVVKNTTIDYHSPARLDDELKLTVVVARIGHAFVEFIQQAWHINNNTPKLLASGRIIVVCINTKTFKPQAIPQQVLKKITPVIPIKGKELVANF